ncbi:MAG: hypothetical protein IKW60_04435 [Clostridia bacterium]|nr:hypothetical protein [Clostridia bacterium]
MGRKIICILVALATLCSLMVVQVSAADYIAENTQLDVLKALEIVNGYENENQAFSKMNKATFINFLLNMMEGGKYTAAYDGDALLQAEQLGLIETASAVGQSDVLRNDEAVKMAMSLLGYKDLCMEMGGYPAGFLVKANQIGLTDGLTLSEEMTNLEAYHLLYETMNTGVMDVVAYGTEGNSYAEYEDRTILNIYRRIYQVEGVVTANGISGLYEPAAVSEGYVAIEGDLYQDTNGLLYDYLGYKVLAYAKKETDGSFSIVYGEPYQTVEVVEIDSNNILNVASDISSIEYYSDENASSSRKINLPPTIVVLSNNVVWSDYTAADFTKPDGLVTLIDQQGDNNIDVVKLDFTRTMIVSSVSTSTKTISGVYTYTGAFSKLELKPYDDPGNRVEFFLNGEAATFEDVKQGDVLSVYESNGAGGKVARISIIRNKVVETVTAYYQAENELVAGDVVYELSALYQKATSESEQFAEPIVVGKSYAFYLDENGKIIGARTESNDGVQYGYLKAVGDGKGVFDVPVILRIFTAEGEWKEFNFAEKVKVNGNSADTAANAKAHAQSAIGKLIGYSLNSEGAIVRLETPQSIAEFQDAATLNPERLNVLPIASNTFRYNNTTFGGVHYMTGNTKVFFVPSEEPDNEDLYDIGNNYSFRSNIGYSYTGYNTDEFGFLDMVLVELNQTDSKKPTDSVYFVREVGTGIDGEGNAVGQITVASAAYYGVSILVDDSYDISGINPGDLIKIHVNAKGYVDNLEQIYKVSDKVVLSAPSVIEDGRIQGVIDKMDLSGERIRVDTMRDAKETKLGLKVPASISVMIYDAKRNTVTAGKTADLSMDDFIIVQLNKNNVAGIYVYRNFSNL